MSQKIDDKCIGCGNDIKVWPQNYSKSRCNDCHATELAKKQGVTGTADIIKDTQKTTKIKAEIKTDGAILGSLNANSSAFRRVGGFSLMKVEHVEKGDDALKILGKYVEAKPADRPPMIICLDSLGMLSTTKEMEDTAEGKETKDMTRAQITKGAFRVLTLKLGKTKVPLLVTNHTYKQVGTMFPQDVMGGGMGLYYAASSILFLSRRKEKS